MKIDEEASPLSSGLTAFKTKKSIKPTMRIHVHTSASSHDNSWDKEELKRLKEEIAAIESHLSNFDREKAADQVHSSVKTELMSKKARHAELKARVQ